MNCVNKVSVVFDTSQVCFLTEGASHDAMIPPEDLSVRAEPGTVHVGGAELQRGWEVISKLLQSPAVQGFSAQWNKDEDRPETDPAGGALPGKCRVHSHRAPVSCQT